MRAAAVAFAACPFVAFASDHLDTHTVVENPAADIADLYAWTASDGRRLNLVMTLVGDEFAGDLRYAFHVDAGARFGDTSATTPIVCEITGHAVDCTVGDVDRARGDAGAEPGLAGEQGRFRVFAGLRDDPFFNNVRGTRDALGKAGAALKAGVETDAAGCPRFDAATSNAILEAWHHTDGGPATNFLVDFKSASLVISVDLEAVAGGGRMLAIWGATYDADGAQLDRMGRPLTGNALLAPLAPDDVSDALKERYNRAAPSRWRESMPELVKTLALYDGFDGVCGNQWWADREPERTLRYHALTRLLADDRLWVNAASTRCERFLGVELAEAEISALPLADCGGRTPNHDAVDVFRSLLIFGATRGAADGVVRDERTHSDTRFPFLAAP